jgi:hypothetical protein
MTVRELLERIDSAELTEWIAFDQLEPFGEARADVRAGVIAAATVNSGFRRPENNVSPIDFCLFAERETDDGILLEDPQAQSALIASTIFKGVEIEEPMKPKRKV